ncbi:MAG: cysteine desulfurase [Bacilli bacterium]|nr:cysteine desulfurase [Bacilli bacterium]
MHREDIPLLNQDVIYFDNGATTLKPQCVIDSIVDYYSNYCSNAHRGDYKISLEVDDMYEGVRDKIRRFINAEDVSEIVYTSGTTDAINKVVFGYFGEFLKKGDEVLITKSEHASNVLPWFVLEKKLGIVVKYIPLNDNYEVDVSNVKKMINDKTKVISIAYVTNVIGDIRPIKEICKVAHENDILVVVDGAQSIGHIKVDVKADDIDFLACSGHKMYGPTGIGFLYGKYNLLEKIKPLVYGGDMNATFTEDGSYELKDVPVRLEAGTQNIAGVIGLGRAIDYISSMGVNNILTHEHQLKDYLVSELEKLDNIEIYNKNTVGSIVAFNVKDIFSQDVAVYLDKYNICVRAGTHCAKMIKDVLDVNNTCRVSLAFYNNKEEIDKLIEVLKNIDNIYNEII